MNNIYIVGLPIGNIRDITLRALDVLKSVDFIACEDTRVTRKLLSLLDLKAPKLIAYHDKNEANSAKGIVQLIREGNSVAVVSDAGMPVISDPGFKVIEACIQEDIKIDLIPGVSAVLNTLVLSNFDTKFKFLGFLKPKTGQRKNQLSKLEPGTYIAFLSPHRLISELEDISEVFGSETRVFLGRELTKKFETHYRGTVNEVLESVKDEIKGEFSVAFEVPKRKKVNKYANKA